MFPVRSGLLDIIKHQFTCVIYWLEKALYNHWAHFSDSSIIRHKFKHMSNKAWSLPEATVIEPADGTVLYSTLPTTSYDWHFWVLPSQWCENSSGFVLCILTSALPNTVVSSPLMIEARPGVLLMFKLGMEQNIRWWKWTDCNRVACGPTSGILLGLFSP